MTETAPSRSTSGLCLRRLGRATCPIVRHGSHTAGLPMSYSVSPVYTVTLTMTGQGSATNVNVVALALLYPKAPPSTLKMQLGASPKDGLERRVSPCSRLKPMFYLEPCSSGILAPKLSSSSRPPPSCTRAAVDTSDRRPEHKSWFHIRALRV